MNWFRRIRQFLIEVTAELNKTSWPNRKEVTGTTVVVIIFVIICAGYLFVVDFVLNSAVDFVFKRLGGFGG